MKTYEKKYKKKLSKKKREKEIEVKIKKATIVACKHLHMGYVKNGFHLYVLLVNSMNLLKKEFMLVPTNTNQYIPFEKFQFNLYLYI